MAGKRKAPRFDSHQVMGAMIIGGILIAMIGFAFQRWDVAVLAGFGVAVVAAMVAPRHPGRHDESRGGDIYDGSDCGGDGGD